MLFIAAIIDKRIEIWIPSFAMMQCGNYNNVKQYDSSLAYAVASYINYEFILLIIFIMCIFKLRHIKDEFNINSELRVMTTLLLISDLLYISSILFLYDTVYVVLGFLEYIEVLLSLSLLYVTSISPII